ncbi:hypothetical protein DSO57_1012307 [Entomophthora muscae]|uniref:Uncharacterized protein n=1 Tax=Entomophthora muscae TaxID=34485 RepID=A0ACC2T5X6_9FUNG|nr:hypothetical protein DSO57_1012307 [Entomophthora muscae]
MTLPLTPQPNCLQESVTTSKSTSTQLFGVMYITLTGLVNSMVPSNGPWVILGKFLYYIVKLAPIIWWAKTPACRLPAASSQELPTGWIPENGTECLLPMTFPSVFPLVPSYSSHPSNPLDSILVVYLTRMGAKLSYFSPLLSQFIALIYHKSLIYFKTQTNLLHSQVLWTMFLERSNMNIQYNPGPELFTADALSQLYVQASRSQNGLDS